jgi:DNA modification methylase
MTILNGDWIENLKTLPDCAVQCCVTSPPYWGLRDYGVAGQLGLEKTHEEYVEKMVIGFREVKRVLKDDGTLWLNLGDSYWGGKGENGSSKARATADERGYIQSGGTVQMSKRPQDSRHNIIKPKDIVGIPWRVAFALQSDGWYLRQDIIWAKPNPMPESVTDRCTKSHEYIFLLSKSARYFYDADAIKERQAESSAERALYGWNGRNDDGSNGARTGAGIRKMKESGMSMGEAGLIPLDGMRNKRSVWLITTKPYKEAHFATFPEEIPRTCILAGSKKGDTILDPFSGAGTTGVVAEKLDRKYIGIELNPQYIKLAEDRIYNVQPLFAGLE